MGFVHYSLFNDARCKLGDRALTRRFNQDTDCIFGRLFEVMECPHWKDDTTSTTSSTTTSSTTSTFVPVQNGSTHSESTMEPPTPSGTTMYTTVDTVDAPKPQTTSLNDTNTTLPGDLLKSQEEECVNMFGGGDLGDLDCHYLADIIWAIIVMVTGIIACLL